MQLAGKTVIITGASRGIGRALAREFGARGSRLLLTGLEAEELNAVARDLVSAGTAALAFPSDLVTDAGMQSFVEWIQSRDPPPDILVNNAGGGRFGRFASTPWRDSERTLELNAVVPTRLIHHLLPVLTRRPEAAIVTISSATGRLPYPGLAVYGACKGYLSSLSHTLECELAGTPVRMLCMHPGFTRTHFMSSAGMDMRRVPGLLIRPPEAVATAVIRMLEKNRSWSFGDPVTRIGIWLAGLLPHAIKTRVFRRLYWDLPDET